MSDASLALKRMRLSARLSERIAVLNRYLKNVDTSPGIIYTNLWDLLVCWDDFIETCRGMSIGRIHMLDEHNRYIELRLLPLSWNTIDLFMHYILGNRGRFQIFLS